jgi:hypothetical protein
LTNAYDVTKKDILPNQKGRHPTKPVEQRMGLLMSEKNLTDALAANPTGKQYLVLHQSRFNM